MSAAFRCARFAIVVLCLVTAAAANDDSAHAKHRAKKPELPPLPSGPTGPVPAIPLDSIAPTAPQVTYQNGQLTIVATNSTLGDILKAVRKQTQAEIEIPEAKERVVTHLGPGPAREVIAALLNGSRFNYVLLGSPLDATALTRVVLVAKTGPDNAGAAQPLQSGQFGMNQSPRMGQPQQPVDATDTDAAEENSDDNADDPTAAAEQPPPQQEQQEIKTPQQMLQEMQQRQMQMQQQGQPPAPGTGMQPHPPQQN